MATFARTITTEEKERLQQYTTADAQLTCRRARCILMSSRGKTTAEIGVALGFTERSARNIIRAFNEVGMHSIDRAAVTGRPRLLADMPTDAIEEIIAASPREFHVDSDYWSLESLAEILSIRHGEDISRDTLGRELMRRGIDWGQVKATRAGLGAHPATMGESKKHRVSRRMLDQPDHIYAGGLLRPSECKTYDAVARNLRKEFSVLGGVDEMHLQLAAVCYLKLAKAHMEENWEKAEHMDRMLNGHLAALKAAKKKQEASATQPSGDSPAEWATEVLERLAAAEESDGPMDASDLSKDDIHDLMQKSYEQWKEQRRSQ